MPSASATERLIREDTKLRCAEPGRSKSGRCNAAVLIDDEIKCRGGHKHSLEELVVAATEKTARNLLPLLKHWLAMAKGDLPHARELAIAAINEVLSPPYSTERRSGDERIYRWMVHDPYRFDHLLYLADAVAPDAAEALRRIWVRQSYANGELNEALLVLEKRYDESHDYAALIQRDHLIDCSQTNRSGMYRDTSEARHFYLCIEAKKILGNTDDLWLYEDSLKEASTAVSDKGINPILYHGHDNQSSRSYFYLYLRRPGPGSDRVISAVSIRIFDNGQFCEPEASGLAGFPDETASSTDVMDAVKRILSHDSEGKVLRVRHGSISLMDRSITQKPQWLLPVLAELRQLFYFMRV